jgi:L-lactate utilization protein LutB
MDNPIESYWNIRLETVKERFEKNNFEVFLAKNRDDARHIVKTVIIPDTGAKSVSWGGSATFVQTGLYDDLKDSQDLEVLDTYDKSFTPEEAWERRRRSILVDLFITGTNAITEDGELVNLDMIGNRICGLTFGPRNVVVLVGRNKLVGDVEEAMVRIKTYAASVNTMRLDKKTPCIKTARCMDCSSPDRICNTWMITEKCFPKGRVKLVIINEDLGF